MVAAADDEGQRRRSRGDRALGLPDLRLLLGHVHRQFDELPDRGARPVAARQRHGRWRPTPTASASSSRPGISSSTWPAATTSRTTRACCRAAIASFEAFENAMTLDIAMGGSTNTVLHLLAAAHEGEIPFTMADIDRLSRRVPVLCKVAPSVADVHIEDVHRAGGIMAILGELDRAGLLNRDVADGARRIARRTRSRATTSSARSSNATREFFSRGARRRADPDRLQPAGAATSRSTRPRQGRDPRRRARLLARTAASRCSTAISPSTAAS